MKINRRHFIGATAAATLAAPLVNAGGHGRPKVVVIGGGAGGATAARYIAKDSKVRLTSPWLNHPAAITPAFSLTYTSAGSAA